MKTRSSRRQTSNDYVGRDSYRDSHSSRKSSRYKANYELKTFRSYRQEEKVRNVFTNPYVSCSRITSYFQVSKDLIDKLHLHYLPDERRFHLIEKGKVENEIKPQAPKGKQGDNLEWFPPKEGGHENNMTDMTYQAWVGWKTSFSVKNEPTL
ncbi:hypothetical protein PVK06_047744 [Gossypium arboreum]|uniref:Uncharacterized protein n=1 Tax=Gossypium arboreum TaxID=29729 RepID=A0ABR0MG14_GOSAR|nr:hypothetical protein PVK06_047744 [Gossypium arboreum]